MGQALHLVPPYPVAVSSGEESEQQQQQQQQQQQHSSASSSSCQESPVVTPTSTRSTGTTTDNDDRCSQTEERACSPITVLEARYGAEKTHPSSAHPSTHSSPQWGPRHSTSTNTTNFGSPTSATTTTHLSSDDVGSHCVQLTVHSESHVHLHAYKWQD